MNITEYNFEVFKKLMYEYKIIMVYMMENGIKRLIEKDKKNIMEKDLKIKEYKDNQDNQDNQDNNNNKDDNNKDKDENNNNKRKIDNI